MHDNESLRILLVEDDLFSRLAIERLLRAPGRTVTSVDSLRAARRACAEDGFEILLADIGLPDGSGLPLGGLLKGRGRALAVAMTGYCTPEDTRAITEAGYDCCLAKPFSFAELEQILARAKPHMQSDGPAGCRDLPAGGGYLRRMKHNRYIRQIENAGWTVSVHVAPAADLGPEEQVVELRAVHPDRPEDVKAVQCERGIGREELDEAAQKLAEMLGIRLEEGR